MRTPQRNLVPFVCLTLVSMVAVSSSAQAPERGRILGVRADKTSYRPGDEVQVWVEVQNVQRSERRQLVVLNLLDGERAVYDSHERKQDIDITLKAGERRAAGPFRITLPTSLRRGSYTLLAGYREYPWEPLIAFQGASWCPPQHAIHVQ